jgi:hypothetical protein
MNKPDDTSKIVDLQQRQSMQAAGGDRLGDLLRAVRATALKRLHGLVATLFENIDDALFDLAEKAENNAIQTQYFDGMREVRKKRQLFERVYQEQLGRLFNDFANGKLQANRPDPSKAEGDGLSLVEDSELEESLAIASAVAKNEGRLARPLYAMNQRLAVLRGGAKVEDSTNPIGPAQLCQGFRIAMRELELNLQTQLIVYKLFDRYVLAGLDPLYEEIDAQLIQAGGALRWRCACRSGSGRLSGPIRCGRRATSGRVVQHGARTARESPRQFAAKRGRCRFRAGHGRAVHRADRSVVRADLAAEPDLGGAEQCVFGGRRSPGRAADQAGPARPGRQTAR